MAGLYVHIPFCLQKCQYCDFVSYSGCDGQVKEAYAKRVIEDIKRLKATPFETVFIGGGTPTALSSEALCGIVEAICKKGVVNDCEITVEANPETVDKIYSTALKSAGVNRVSMGLQAIQDDILSRIGRVHSYKRFLKAYDALIFAGFDNINIDLMYGLPGQREVDFEHSIEEVTALAPQHISAYALTLNEGTPLYNDYKKGKTVLREGWEYEDALALLSEEYPRYEISNYAKNGYRCRHNINYWQNGEFYGVGCGAHGCLSYENAVANGYNAGECKYIRTACETTIKGYFAEQQPSFTEVSTEEARFEGLMVGLRMIDGIDIKDYKRKYEVDLEEIIGEYIANNQEFIQLKNDRVFMTDRGLDIQNRILVELMDYFR